MEIRQTVIPPTIKQPMGIQQVGNLRQPTATTAVANALLVEVPEIYQSDR